MITDDEARNRMITLAQQLLRRTQKGEISWTEMDVEHKFLYSASQSSATIGFWPNSRRNVLTVLNWRGTPVGELGESYLPGPESAEDSSDEGVMRPAPWNEVLSALHDAARRNALDIEEVLDNLMSELSEEDQNAGGAGDGNT